MEELRPLLTTVVLSMSPEEVPVDLLSAGMFHPYRQYRLFGPEAMVGLWHQFYSNKQLLGLREGAQWKALVGFAALPWDSKILGLRCARVTPMIRLENCSSGELAALIKKLKDQLSLAGVESVDWEIDSGDSRLLSVAQNEEFRIVDTKLTYLLRAQDPFQRPHRRLFDIRTATALDRERILAVAQKSFPAMGGRFYADPTLPPGIADQLYLSWLEGALEPDSKYRTKVAFRQDNLVGFLCYTMSEEILVATGRRVFCRGIGAVLPEASGAYLDLLSESILDDYQQGDAAEFETSITNAGALRIFEKLQFRLVRSRYVLKLQAQTKKTSGLTPEEQAPRLDS